MTRPQLALRGVALVVCLFLATACSSTPAPTSPAPKLAATPLVSAASRPDATPPARAAIPTAIVATAPAAVSAASGDITIFAATSLKDVLAALGVAFTKANPNAHLIFIYANSATFAEELEQGAKADVFASAHPTTMARVGAIVGSIQTFARTSLIIVTPLDNPAQISSLKDLGNPGVKIVNSDPSDAMAQYTQSMLQKASADPTYGSDFPSRVQKNVVSPCDLTPQGG